MKKVAVVTIILAAVMVFAQSSSRKWQSARILEVKKQQNSAADASGDPIERYEVSLRVKDTDYVVLYTPPPGAHGFQYTAGMDKLVLVESQTITINDILGRPIKVPIISQKSAPPRNNP